MRTSFNMSEMSETANRKVFQYSFYYENFVSNRLSLSQRVSSFTIRPDKHVVRNRLCFFFTSTNQFVSIKRFRTKQFPPHDSSHNVYPLNQPHTFTERVTQVDIAVTELRDSIFMSLEWIQLFSWKQLRQPAEIS